MEGAAKLELMPAPPEPKVIIVPPLNRTFTLDQLHETVGIHTTPGRLA